MLKTLPQRNVSQSIFLLGAVFSFVLMMGAVLKSDSFLPLLLPLVLFIGGLAFFKPILFLHLIVFFTPLSLNLENVGLGDSALFFPTEPMLFGLMILILITSLHRRFISLKLLLHPITIAIGMYCIWLLVTSFTSVLPVVSLKFTLAKLWFFIPMYLFTASLIMEKPERSRTLLFTFFVSMMLVSVYTVVRHAGLGFEEDPAHWVMEPFFRDHTQYGAVLSIAIPIGLGLFFESKGKLLRRIICLFGVFIFTVALIYTYSRAAWLSSILALGILIIVVLRIRLWMIFGGAFIVGILLLASVDQILRQLESNKTDSSDNLVENVESITNISTDASNLERINRWKCAIRMFQEKPLLGWGPGTYMFEYAPFQESKDLTIISTNFGDVGNAHNEYLSPLAESGLPGSILFILVVGLIFKSAHNGYLLNIHFDRNRILTLYSALGLVAYFAHGTLNNFLDADKASVPVWMCAAIIVAMELIGKRQSAKKTIQTNVA